MPIEAMEERIDKIEADIVSLATETANMFDEIASALIYLHRQIESKSTEENRQGIEPKANTSKICSKKHLTQEIQKRPMPLISVFAAKEGVL